jgi:peptidoglycan hydrolase-like protein with peptidoglycan-binding domain
MAARIVKSLDTLRSQVNKLAPKRSKASDGWLGDAKHSMRKSDHNPEPDGTVDALDITHDPKGGVDIQRLCDTLIASKDRRISYLICNGKIISGAGGKQPWVKRTYTGPNKHTKHLHVSVKDAGQDDATPWKIEAAFGKASAPAPKPAKVTPVPATPIADKPIKIAPVAVPEPASNKDIIIAVQKRLHDLGYNPGGADGVLGPLTKGSILSFKNDNGLKPVDTLDEEFLTALATAKPRTMVPARANATANEVAAKVPEANAHWWNKWIGGGAAGGASGLAVLDAIAPAKGYVEPVRDLAADVPGWAWLLIVAGIALAITIFAARGQKKAVEAFKAGDRR